MRTALVLAVLAAAGLSGCSDSVSEPLGDARSTSTGGHGAHGDNNAATHIVAPTWQVGQWWALSSDQATEPFTHIVSGEDGDDWTVDTDSPDMAFFNARFDISFLGSVRKSDLAGSQGSDRVEFFRFPLTQDKTWSTDWDGESITILVKAVANGKAHLEARHANGTLYASYSYEDKLGYFRDYTFYGADGITPGFAAKVTSSGLAFSGDLVRWALETVYEAHGPFPGPDAQGFTVQSDVTDVWMDLQIACTQGAFSVTVGPTAGALEQRGFTASGPCPVLLEEISTITPPTQPNESWGVVLASVPQVTQGTFHLTVIVRTQTLFGSGTPPTT